MSATVTTPDGVTRPIDAWPKLLCVFDADGNPVPLMGTAEGYLMVSVTGGSEGGSGGDASAANQTLQLDAVNRLMSYQFGLAGTDTVTDGDLSDVDYYAMRAVTDVMITTVTLADGHSGATAWVERTIYAGETVYLSITAIEFTGTAQLFKRPA